MGLDIERFGRAEWTDPIRVRARARLRRLVDGALADSAIAAVQVHRNDTGDGALILVDGAVPTTRILHPLVMTLARRLADDNGRAPLAERLRLRLVVHAGMVVPDGYGHTGEALTHAARLLNARVGRSILDAVPDADIVLLASDAVYAGVVRHAYDGIDPATYQGVWISEKETTARVWVHLPRVTDQPRLDQLEGGRAALANDRPAQPTAHELPRDIGAFVGREEEVRRLDAIGRSAGRTGAVVISAIDGMGGIGKSALAVHVAHGLADAYPDGQVYLDLRGSTPGLKPLSPIKALEHLLSSLGTPIQQVPADVDAAAARWRSLVADRRVLIVLDNAVSTAQVAPLLPGSPTCMVLVTSRRALAMLGAAIHVSLDVLSPRHAVELLRRIVGVPERVDAEPAAARDVARLCGYLPLALRLAGARLASRRDWTLRRLAGRLSSTTRLDELRDPEVAVRSSLEVSYEELHRSADPTDRRAAAALRLLGAIDIPSISTAIAGRLFDWSDGQAELALERLVDAYLLQPVTSGRYRLHDLVRLYARERSMRDDPEPVRRNALERVLDRYIATAWRASHLLQPGAHAQQGTTSRAADPLPLDDRRAALDWLEDEQPNLLALAQQAAGLSDHLAAGTVELALALRWGMAIRGRWRDMETLARLAAPIARGLGDDRNHADLLIDLGHACWRLGRVAEGPGYIEDALLAFGALGDRAGQSRALHGLASMYFEQGYWQAARSASECELRLCREMGDRHGEAYALVTLSDIDKRLGAMDTALLRIQEALTVFQAAGDRYGEGVALSTLGQILLASGHLQTARRYCVQAIQIARELGDRDTESAALSDHGETLRLAGDLVSATKDQEHALQIACEIGNRTAEAKALWRLGLGFRDGGRHQQGAACWRKAMIIYEELASPNAAEIRRLLETSASRTAG